MFHIILEQNIPCLSYRQIVDWESHVLKLIARRLESLNKIGFCACIVSKKERMEISICSGMCIHYYSWRERINGCKMGKIRR